MSQSPESARPTKQNLTDVSLMSGETISAAGAVVFNSKSLTNQHEISDVILYVAGPKV